MNLILANANCAVGRDSLDLWAISHNKPWVRDVVVRGDSCRFSMGIEFRGRSTKTRSKVRKADAVRHLRVL